MSAPESAEEERAYREISEQRRTKAAQYNTVQNQIVQKKKMKRRSELCLAEVEQLPENTTSYKAVGRMFVACPLPQIKTELKAIITKSDEDIAKFEPQEKHLEREIQQLDKNLEELADDNEAKRSTK